MNSKPVTRRDALKHGSAAALGASAAAGLLAAKPHVAEAAPDSDRKIRIGVVGGGFGAAFHWHQDPNCVVTGVTDLREDRRRILRDRYKCDAVYDSLETMIKDAKDIDAVAIFTEATNHEKHVRMSMERGWHVISAVPACVSLEEAASLKEIKEKTGLKYMMAETSYYRLYAIAARELYQQGRFGDLFYSEVEYYHPMAKREREQYFYYKGERTWRYAFPPMHYPTHSTGLLVGVTGERLASVSSLGWGNKKDSDWNTILADNAYDNPFNVGSALFQTSRGHICRCNQFWDGTAHGERAQWFGTKLTFYMPGSAGQQFRLQGPDAPKWDRLPDYGQTLPESMRGDSGHGGSHPFLTHEFITALVEEREPAVDIYESLAMTVPGIVAQQSALKDGEQMKVPSFDKA